MLHVTVMYPDGSKEIISLKTSVEEDFVYIENPNELGPDGAMEYIEMSINQDRETSGTYEEPLNEETAAEDDETVYAKVKWNLKGKKELRAVKEGW